jgi:hypothetical protein
MENATLLSLERFNRVQYKQNDVVMELQPQEQHPMSSADCKSCNENNIITGIFQHLGDPFPNCKIPNRRGRRPEFVTGSSE